MFSWVCPRCGRDNPPSAIDCKNCAELDRQVAQAGDQAPVAEPAYQPHPQQPPAPQAAPVYYQPAEQHPAYIQPSAPSQPAYTPPPVQQQPVYIPPAPPRQPVYAPPTSPPPLQQHPAYMPPPVPPPVQQQPVYAQPPQREAVRVPFQQPEPRRPEPPQPPAKGRGLPTWLLMALFAFAFLGLGAAIYFGYQKFSKPGPAGFTGGEQAAAATAKKTPSSPLQKYIEVVGVRLTTDAKKRPVARFVVVNHAGSAFNDLEANVTLWASTSRSEEDAVGTFSFKVPNIGPSDAKDVTAPLKTKLKIYELPDWQNLTAEVQIISQE